MTTVGQKILIISMIVDYITTCSAFTRCYFMDNQQNSKHIISFSPVIFVFIPLRYRLSTDLIPDYYNITLWPRLSREANTGLYIFTGDYRTSYLQHVSCGYTDFNSIKVAAGGETRLFKSSIMDARKKQSFRSEWLVF